MEFHKDQNEQFNLTNHRLATRWIVERWCAVERWRAIRKNPKLVIGQKRGGGNTWIPLIHPAQIPGPTRTGALVIVEPGPTHCSSFENNIINKFDNILGMFGQDVHSLSQVPT